MELIELATLKSIFILSTLVLLVGWLLQRLWQRRAARAYQLLSLCLLASLLIPALSLVVQKCNWGVVPEKSRFSAIPMWLNQGRPEQSVLSLPEEALERSSETKPLQHHEQVASDDYQKVSTLNWNFNLLWLWPVLTGLMLLRVIVAFARGVRRLNRARDIESLPEEIALEEIGHRLGLTTSIKVVASDEVYCPVIWGWGRGITILVPSGFFAAWPVKDLNAIFCHELAHYKRRDHVMGFVSELALCLMPWQPLMWWAKQRLVTLSEHACDDWVVACGYQEVDYAESLLDMLPQRQYAFVPAVATRQSSLSRRVKRILAQQCGNPTLGRIWASTALALVLLAAVGFSLVQVHAEAMEDCRYCAHDRQSLYEMSLHGRVYDANGPLNDADTLVTIMPMTSFCAQTNYDDFFVEIPYAEEWCVDGKISLLARCPEKNLAASMRVSYGTRHVEIFLQPGCQIQGRALDREGLPVSHAEVWLEWKGPYTCPMPLCFETTDADGYFTLTAIPTEQEFSLTIKTEQWTSLVQTVSTHGLLDRQMNHLEVDLSVPVEDDMPTEWRQAFDAVYSLQEGQAAKFIKAPFIPERQDYIQYGLIRNNRFREIVTTGYVSFLFSWDGVITPNGAYGCEEPMGAKDLLQWSLFVEPYDFNIPTTVTDLRYLCHGDWICDPNASVEERLRVMESVIQQELGRTVRFEKQILNQDTVIVSGVYHFTPLEGASDPNVVCLMDREGDEGQGDGEVTASLDEFLDYVGHWIHLPMINQAGVAESFPIAYKDPHWMFLESDQNIKSRVAYLLGSLSQQTGLQFEIESRLREVWVLTEETP